MNRTKNNNGKRLLALGLAMLLGLGTLPQTVLAVNESPLISTGGKITAFEPLADSVANQTVPLGTALEDLNLPDTLTATVEAETSAEQAAGDSGSEQDPGTAVQENTADTHTDTQDGDSGGEASVSGNNVPGSAADEQQNGTPSDAPGERKVDDTGDTGSNDGVPASDNTGVTQQTISITVLEWTSEPEYDPNAPDTYVFTPVLEEAYTLAEDAALPTVTVEVVTPVSPFARSAQIQGGTPDFELYGSVIGFGGHEWVVIGYDGSGVASTSDTITLLLKNGDAGGGYSTTQFGNTTDYLYNIFSYSGGALDSAMNEVYTGLPQGERKLILPRSDLDAKNNGTGTETLSRYVWPLSVSEANQLHNTELQYSAFWWLRSPGNLDNNAAYVTSGGTVNENGFDVLNNRAVRPAFKLDLSSVLFTSAASGASAKPTAVGPSLSAAEQPAGAVKFTMLEDVTSNLKLTSSTASIAAAPGETVNINYADAVTGANKYVSAVLTNTSNEVLYYGKLVDLTGGSAGGTASFTMPDDLEDGSYTLKLFNEECNGDNLTDFAGTPAEIALTVTSGGSGGAGSDWVGKTVYFGKNTLVAHSGNNGDNSPIPWRVMAEESGVLTLLSDGSLGKRYYDLSGHNNWSGSDIAHYLNGTDSYSGSGFLQSAFAVAERNAILSEYSTSPEETNGFFITPDQAIVLPAFSEVRNGGTWGWTQDSDRSIGGSWLLRSPGDDVYYAARVTSGGTVYELGSSVNSADAVRPAFKLDLASVLFTSAASGASAKPTSVGASLSAAEQPTGAVKFTMLEDVTSNLKLTSSTASIAAAPGETVNINYADAVTGANKYVSAVLTNTSNEVLYYGKLVDLTGGSAGGTASFTMPDDLEDGSYTLKLFNEECNGDNLTDFASTPAEIALTVTSGGSGGAGSDWVGKTVYFGKNTLVAHSDNNGDNSPIPWRVMAEESGVLTLLSDGSLGKRKYDSNKHNNWSGSDIAHYLNGTDSYNGNGFLQSAFAVAERNAILSEYSTSPEETNGFFITPDQAIVLPAFSEVINGGTWGWTQDSDRSIDDLWWLRSPGNYVYFAAYVNSGGAVDGNGYDVRSPYAVRPAFKLDLSSVLFTSAASGASAKPTAVGPSLSAAEQPAGAVKFTMLEDVTSNLKLTSSTASIAAAPGETVNINYADAVTGANKYVSAVLTNTSNEVLYYGKLVDLTGGSAGGTASFTMPDDLEDGSYTLKLFNEECNGDNLTDFASMPAEIALTVQENGGGGNDSFATGTWTGENGHRWVALGGILWRILEVYDSDGSTDDNSGKKTALLLAEETVATRQFHTTWNSGDNDWNSSDLKAWLNNEVCTKNSKDYTADGFMSGFRDEEKAAIVTASYTYGGSNAGNDTAASSRVFLLSTDEAISSAYFASNADRNISNGFWWLRSPGSSDNRAEIVTSGGMVSEFGYDVDSDRAVRPALKIDLESPIFTSKKPLVQAQITVESGGSPVADASISFSGASAPDDPVVSEGGGKATVRLELGESYSMTVSKTGYEPYEDEITITQTDQAISVNLTPSDAIRPKVESIAPANGSTDRELSGDIVITFNEPMNTSAGTVSLDHGIGTLTGGRWEATAVANDTYTIGYSGLAYSTGYTITVEDFEDAAGNGIAPDPAPYSFTTKARPASPEVSPLTLHLDLNGNETGSLTISLGQSGNRAARADITVDSGHESDISVNPAVLTDDGTVTVTGLRTVSGAGITVSFSGGTATPADIPVTVNVTDSTPTPGTSYTITFDANGGSVSPATVQTNDEGKLSALPTPARSGSYSFHGWYTAAGGGTLISTSTVFTGNDTLYAHWTYTGGSGDSGGSSSSSSTPTVTIPAAVPPDQPTIGSVSGKVAGTNTQRGFTVTDSMVKAALEKAQAEAKAKDRTAYGVGVQIALDTPATAGLTVTLERAALNRLVSTGAKRFALTGTPISLAFDAQALAELQKQGTGDVTLTVKPATVKKVRNAYAITLTTVKDGKKVSITSLGSGSATLSIPMKPGKNETAGYFYAVYVDEKGKRNRIADSAYDANSGSMIFSTSHFSVYGVGYTAPASKFTDIGSHWAKESIDYVVGRGLLEGTSDTTFAPDTAMTRGMLVTALGRLANVDTKAYTTNSFTDVKADSAFRPYIEWAYSKGIVQGSGNSQFAPDRAITRQELAAILQSYAKATGYTLPVTRTATTFSDTSGIGSAYKTAVTAMQQAGIMTGGSGSKFNPAANATRAEVSAMLHRYSKLTIDPATAQGWALNDAGQFFYYKDGKALTGIQTIDGVKYDFNTDGTMKTASEVIQ